MTQNANYFQPSDSYNLMERVIERSNLEKALKRVELNKGAPGADGMNVTELRPYLKVNWKCTEQELLMGTYKPTPVRRVEISKRDGGVRGLGIPTALDRFIQQAIQQILTPIFDPLFSESSYGFRPKRSARQAVFQAQAYIKTGRRYVVDIDLEKFFDRVNHDILMSKLYKQINDARVLKLIRKYLKSGIMINGCKVASDQGTPQGGPLSPLLANIMLDDLDKELEKRGHKFARYADDFNIYVLSKRAGRRIYESIKNFLRDKLKLKINENKSAVGISSKRRFLGFSIALCKEKKIRLATESKVRFKDRIRDLTSRSKSESLTEKIWKLNEYLLGWMGYFKIARTRSVFESLDKWIRRRLRMCLIKQWKRSATKLWNLKRLGIPEEWAWRIAYSRKKYWRLSNTPQVSKALGIAYWKNQGLVSLVEKYDQMDLIS